MKRDYRLFLKDIIDAIKIEIPKVKPGLKKILEEMEKKG